MGAHAPERDPIPATRRAVSRLTVISEHPAADATVPDSQSGPRARTARGALLAVCGLCGGAGASTLAYLVALSETRWQADSVLVGDTGGPGGGIACYAGVEAPRSLVEVATNVAAGLPAGQLVATTEAGVRVLATLPTTPTPAGATGATPTGTTSTRASTSSCSPARSRSKRRC